MIKKKIIFSEIVVAIDVAYVALYIGRSVAKVLDINRIQSMQSNAGPL